MPFSLPTADSHMPSSTRGLSVCACTAGNESATSLTLALGKKKGMSPRSVFG